MAVCASRVNWFWFIVINVVSIASIIEYVGANDELVSAHVVYRHGNRSIVKTYPTDPYKDEKWWPDGNGELTNSGKHFQHRLGQFLRRRYLKLIGEKYTQDSVYIQSDATDRNLMSASCNSYGLFPAFGDQEWSPGLNWQPIPVHQLPPHLQHLMGPQISCGRVDVLYAEYLNSSEIQSQLKQVKNLRKYLEHYTGLPFNMLPSFLLIYDVFETETLRGLPLPEWARPIWANEKRILEYFAVLTYLGYSHNTELKKISAGFLIRNFLDEFKLVRMTSLRQPKKKLWLYSAHDLTIVTLMNALNVYTQFRIPPFASSLHFELYRRASDEFYVQLFYRNDDSEHLPPIEIPGCGTKCPLDKFSKLYAHILPKLDETFHSMCEV